MRGNENPAHGCATRHVQSRKVLCRITTGEAVLKRGAEELLQAAHDAGVYRAGEVDQLPDPEFVHDKIDLRIVEHEQQ